ncbi:hypothetical protein LWI29_037820 [Acer saccharum]|uniref:Uncharacterized protein n=1 Tax=Acer saccharum TaxID=4024 RepID=A0AA39VH93_ACESA|nr:hypothetical protein LWI29_037820 [Acer saccharum]
MPIRNYKTLVTEEKLKSYGLIPELLNNRKHQSDPICGKAVRAVKTVQLTSCHDKEENVKQGNSRPDDPDLTKDSDSHVPALGVAAAGSSARPAPQKSEYFGPPLKKKKSLSRPIFPKAL